MTARVAAAVAGYVLSVVGCAAPREASTAARLTSDAAGSTAATQRATGAAAATASQPSPNRDLHHSEHHRHVFPALLQHRPVYFLVGPIPANAKFQFSTKVPLLFPGGPDEPDPVFSNLYFGYTQMSLWDIEEPGRATIDTTFQPELFFATQTPPVDFPGFRASGVGLQAGVQHESNGRAGDASRNANYFYLQPTVYFGDRKALHGELAVKGRVFFASLEGNEDLEDFYGHAEVYGALRFGDGLHVTAMGRLGDDPGRGALQVDFTYPLRRLRLDAYLHLQYFNGFTESLLEYNRHHQELRLGVSFVR